MPANAAFFLILAILLLLLQMASAASFYDFAPADAKGEQFSFAQLKDHVVLIVNVASKCGFTSQYKGLEEIYKKYKDQGFTIIGFPSNQFGSQEPGTNNEIQQFCQVNYGVSFPVLGKIDVNGDKEDAVFGWLKDKKAGLLGLKRIKWNFEKFLVDKNGNVVNRYASTAKPESIAKDVENLLTGNKVEPTDFEAKHEL